MASRGRPRVITNTYSVKKVTLRERVAVPLSRIQPRKRYEQVTYFIRRRPFLSFLLALLLLFALIAASNLLTPKKEEVAKPETIKNVEIYNIGTTPKITLQAKVEKDGVIKITALTGGVVQSINVKEGDIVERGTTLVNLSANYQGGNAASIQTQIAQKQYQNTKDSLAVQKDTIRLQREIAEKTDANADQLRDITDDSLQETRDLISSNEGLLDTLSDNQETLEALPQTPEVTQQILALRAQRIQLQSGLNQLRQGLRQSEFQSAGDRPPAQLSDVSRELTLKNLDVQNRALDLGLEVARLQVLASQINESLYFPTSPFAAKIQRINIKVGQAVSPGTPLFTISAVEDPINAIVNLPHNLAASVSTAEPSVLRFGDSEIELLPRFVSTEATDGTLYAVIYTIPDLYSPELTEGGYVSVEIPVSSPVSSSEVPFVPIDSVYQSTDKSFVFLANGEKVESREVELGVVFGRFVQIKNGLESGDKVIINRNVLAGDKIRIQSSE
jgi:multidrug efflux pump subunit AcrA (membrane-fusion protein)